MKSFFFLILMATSTFSNAQMVSFVKTNEFAEIKKNLSNLTFNNLENIWLSGFDEDKEPQIIGNSYIWSDSGDFHQILLGNHHVIISYHLSSGTNQGTVIYDRSSKVVKTFHFVENKIIKENTLDITKDFISQSGRRWQNGKMNLSTHNIIWNKNLER